jgi:hypothetical protein
MLSVKGSSVEEGGGKGKQEEIRSRQKRGLNSSCRLADDILYFLAAKTSIWRGKNNKGKTRQQ